MPNLIACRACGNSVSSDAKACPKCGAQPRHLGFLQVAVGLVLLLVIIGAVKGITGAVERDRSGLSAGRERTAVPVPAPRSIEPSAPPARAADPESPPLEVSPEQLRKDYAANEVSADERYRGKVLVVTGTVKAIKKDFLDEPYIQLATGRGFDAVDARFDKSAGPALGKLSAGARVTVRCVGNNVAMGDPQLKDCALQ